MNNIRLQRVNTRGAALLIFVVLFVFISALLTVTIGNGAYASLREYRVLEASKKSFNVTEAGIEDAIYRHKDNKAYSNTEILTLDGSTATVTRSLNADTYTFVVEGNEQNAIRRNSMDLAIGTGASFNFGLQSGNGGITMSNSSSVVGNVYSNGSIVGQGSAIVRGDVISAGSSGLIDSVRATGSAYAHTITSSTIDKDAYYQSIVGSTVFGSACLMNTHCHPGSTDQATSAMPISDEKIDEWKSNIQSGGTIITATSTQCSTGTYVIDTNTTLGDVKIMCNVEMQKKGAGTTITLTGPVWIVGNLSITRGPTIVASSSLNTRSVQLIVDNESNRATSSKISVNQSTTFGSGNASSYVLLLSMNTSAENAGTEKAIDLAQSTNGKVLVYAPHGLIDMGNSISLKEVTAYQIEISNGAQVVYESGLVSVLFTSGPGGGYTINSWDEI